MLELSLFIAAQWLAGRAMRKFGGPSILAEMITGVILGPEVLKLVPYAKEDPITHDPSILVLIGNMGVALMIFESGMHLHFDKVAEVGKQALAIAIVGTLAPIILGAAVGMAIGFDLFPDAISMGIALAPTSVGISLKMLGEAKFLNSMPGQTIITAAFIDDIFSLVMLVILINVAAGDVTAGSIAVPLVASFAFVGGGAWAAVNVMPRIKQLINRAGESRGASLQPRDEVHILIMAVFVVFFGWIGALIGSHLLGTFVAGMLFTNVPRSGLVWGRQVKRIVNWMMRLFFSASIAFSIPVSIMFTTEAFWKGAILAAVPCIGGKLLSGLFMGDIKWLVGWAMVARGEFAYLVAQTAKDTGCVSCSANGVTGLQPFMLSAKGYSALVWALLWSTVMAPICFKLVLKVFVKKRGSLERATSIGGNLASQAGQRFVVRIVGTHHSGILHEVMDVLHACELDVLEAHAESDDVIDVDKFVVVPRMGGDFDDDKLHEIAERVKEAINDDQSQVIFEPVDFAKDLAQVGVLQIRMIGDHHPDILHEIFDLLALEKLDVMRAIMDEHTAMDSHGSSSDHDTPRGRSSSMDKRAGRSRVVSWTGKRSQTPTIAEDSGDDDWAKSPTAVSNPGKPSPRPAMHRQRSASMLKESETIYARSMRDAEGKRAAISAVKRANLRESIQKLIESHDGCHGEVMLRMVPEEDAHETVHPITAIEKDDEVSIVTTHGKHHPEIIHKCLDVLAALQLDVMHADISQSDGTDGTEDRSVFYIRNIDADAAITATDPARRREIRTKLSAVFAEHGIDGHASVRPLAGDRPAVISERLTADEAIDDSDAIEGAAAAAPVAAGNLEQQLAAAAPGAAESEA
jgi:Kef-type K+ transport system membrane component KefB/predicted amino acid-binding ACT domain protein